MGGNKKKTLAAIEKEQMREELKKQGLLEKKKKDKAEERNKSKSEFIMTLSDNDVMRIIKEMPFITPYQLSKATGVKVSVAKNFLEQLKEKGYLKIVGGVSGRYIYVPVSAAS
ncbi:MAG: hypothetical protein ACP5LF_02100 [Nitrososphaeria archaeon]|nr:hypothetical protein [Conexivisphaerales archaeon]